MLRMLGERIPNPNPVWTTLCGSILEQKTQRELGCKVSGRITVVLEESQFPV